MAFERWRGYLLDRHFQIKNDHFSLKYFLDQRITTPFQSKWLPKLLGFDYEILYKKGKDNQAADALSRIAHGGELSTMEGNSSSFKYSWFAGQLRRKGNLMVGAVDNIKKKFMDHFHNSAKGRHSAVLATTQRLGNGFYLKGLRKIVKNIMSQCDVCQRNKRDLAAYP
ncbi:putative mitochondrial protein [Tanacetum coccineum]